MTFLRGPLIPGQASAPAYMALMATCTPDVDSLVTNPAATAATACPWPHRVDEPLNSWSAGGYWTHTGPGGWYLDAVAQGTWYYGSASTQFARLNTDGTGFIGSLESGYPFACAATRAGIRDRTARADSMKEGFLPARL